MFDYINHFKETYVPDAYVSHVGTNDLMTDKKTGRNLLRNIVTCQGS